MKKPKVIKSFEFWEVVRVCLVIVALMSSAGGAYIKYHDHAKESPTSYAKEIPPCVCEERTPECFPMKNETGIHMFCGRKD